MSQPTVEMADIIQAQGNGFVDRHQNTLSFQQLKVLNAISSCRTAALGGHIDECPRCGHEAISYNSCRNRHCPKCQAQARQRWLTAREQELLEVRYFHVVFTVPHKLNKLVRANPVLLYNLLFQACAQTLLECCMKQTGHGRRRSPPTLEDEVEPGVVLADAAYGNDSAFRAGLRKLKLEYVVGIQGTTSVWKPGEGPLPPRKYKGQGRPPKLLRRGKQQPLAARELALTLPTKAWKKLSWRQGEKRKLSSRFAALRVRPAHRDFERHEAYPEQWLLIEWPQGEAEPAKYWLSNLPPATKLKELVALAKHRWIIERDYQELKQELGLNQYEGRGWRGFHHHGTLCIAAYGFLVSERSRFSPSARADQLRISLPAGSAQIRPRGSPDTGRAA